MLRRRLLPFVLLAGVLFAACSDDEPAEPASSSASGSTAEEPSSSTSSSTTEASATTEGTTATTADGDDGGIPLTGRTGSGSLTYSLAPDRSEFCYRITVRGIGTASKAQVRRTSGEVVLALQPPAEGTVDTCAATDALLIQELQSRPSSFTIEVEGPDGVLTATLE